MRTCEKKNQKASNEAKTRRLKIQPKFRYSEYSHNPHFVPEIKLCGKWLAKLGFEHGGEVVITMSNRQLVIEPVKV